MDANGAVIITPRPSIIFKRRKGGVNIVAPNDSGNYEVSLPPAVYDVTTEIPGFYPIRRAAVRVLPGSLTILNLLPKPRYLVRGTTVSTTERVDIPVPPPKYDRFPVPGQGFSLVIQFEKKRVVNKELNYDGAIFTYKELTIYADKLSFNRRRLQLKAYGRRVIVEDGAKRFQVKNVSLKFKRGEPSINVTS